MASCIGSMCDFEREYELAYAPALLAIDRAVRCADYGGTSWTTREQAESAAAALCLGPGRALLEVGAGAGWPSLLLAALTRCDVVLTDPSTTALRLARERGSRDKLPGRCFVVAADGAALPFPAASFDAVHHADVLCCMTGKGQLLLECRRVARLGARMLFSVIVLARTPATAEEADLLKLGGPPHTDAEADYSELLAATGWELEKRRDVTSEFLRCMEVLLRESELRRTELVSLLGCGEYEARLARRRSTRTAVERGLLRRECFVARC